MIYAIAVVLVLIADQAMKFWTTKNIFLGDVIEFIPGVLNLTNIHNYGAAFSILQEARWFLVAVTLIFIIGIIVLMNLEIIYTKMGRWTTTFILAGAIGNCIDRVLYGYVVDMFEFAFFSFPVFNVADIFITVFGILFCIHVVLHNEPEEVKAANEPGFMRRRREAREARELNDPYANIPKRGEHKTLEEELRAENPDDPFAEWDFGGWVTIPEEKAAPGEEPEESAEPEVPGEPAPMEEPEASVQPAPAPVEEPSFELPGEEEMFSLDDILSEFGDL